MCVHGVPQEYLKQHGLFRNDRFHGTYKDIGLHQRLATNNNTLTDMDQYNPVNPSTIKVVQPGQWFHGKQRPCHIRTRVRWSRHNLP